MNTRVRMAAGRRVLGVVTIVGLFAAAAATASPAAAETGRLWFSVSSDQSFSQSVANYVAQHPSARQLAVSTLNALSADLQAGKAVAIPGTATPTEGLEQVQSASAALSPLILAASSSTPQTADSNPPTTVNPADFSVKGSATNNNFSWNMGLGTFYMEGGFCDPSGCQTTDKIQASTLTDPGAKTSRFQTNTLYLPNEGHYSEVHFQTWVMCYAGEQQCNWENTSNIAPSASLTWYLSSDVNLQGDRISHGFRLWGYFGPTQSWNYTSAKTGQAVCATGSDYACQY